MYGIFHIRPVSVALDSQIWYLFIYITGYLNVRKISKTVDLRTFVGPLVISKLLSLISLLNIIYTVNRDLFLRLLNTKNS